MCEATLRIPSLVSSLLLTGAISPAASISSSERGDTLSPSPTPTAASRRCSYSYDPKSTSEIMQDPSTGHQISPREFSDRGTTVADLLCAIKTFKNSLPGIYSLKCVSNEFL